MSEKLILTATISYGEVDRDERLTLSGVFKHLQEVAITHANQFDTGTKAMAERGESWVLNRMKVAIARYPSYNDEIRIETWSRGITGFRGYREYRVYLRDEPIISASALWVYLNLKTKSLTRVPDAIAESFPCVTADIFEPNLDHLDLPSPKAGSGPPIPLSLRYSDIDGNDHVNNTAYLDFIQTALVKGGFPPRPTELAIKFTREIRSEIASVNVHLEPKSDGLLFSVTTAENLCSVGSMTF